MWSILISGCGIVTEDGCLSDADCVDAFGWGHSCGASGTCEVLEPTERCATSWPAALWDDRDSTRDSLVLGSVVDAGEFEMERDAIRLAVDQVNDLGGIDGRPVGVLECDATGIEDDARSAALNEITTFLVGDGKLPLVIGPITSSDASVVSAGAADAVFISPGASAIALGADVNTGAEVWRTVPSDADIAQAMVRAMIDEGLGKAAIVHSREQGQTDLANAVVATLADAVTEYPDLASELFPYDSQTERDSRVVDAGYANATTVVFLTEKPEDYVDILLAANEIPAYDGLVLFVGPAAYRSTLVDDASGASALFPYLRGVRSATRKGAVADGFNSSFASRYDGADADRSTYAGQAYDSAWAAFSAMMWSGLRTGALAPDGVSEGMASLSFGVPLSLGPSGWNTLTEEFTAARTVDLDGASSPLDFDATTRAIRGPVAVWTIEGGEFVTLTEYAF